MRVLSIQFATTLCGACPLFYDKAPRLENGNFAYPSPWQAGRPHDNGEHDGVHDGPCGSNHRQKKGESSDRGSPRADRAGDKLGVGGAALQDCRSARHSGWTGTVWNPHAVDAGLRFEVL